MKKIILSSLILAVMLATAGVVVAGTEKAGDENSRYLVKSNNGVLKMMYGVNHKFDSGFTTELSKGQLKFLDRLGVETEEVGIYTILARPFCNYNDVCEPDEGENPSCVDCKNIIEDPEPDPGPDPEPEERICYPDEQKPWGIKKVNGGLGGEGVIVAVLDTGVDQNHPDLVENIIGCVAFGYRTCEDGNGHGTHVAGTILANGGSDGLGIFGVAPETKLIAIKILKDNGRGYADDIAVGIRYAADNGANIISMSLGGPTQSSLIKDAVDYAVGKGVLVIASAGNSGPEEDTIGYPAANINVVAVAAFDSSDNTADFSSRGYSLTVGDWIIQEREIEFTAPGVAIESTFNDGCYKFYQGTSMSAPHVAGIAARDWQFNQNDPPEEANETRTYLQGLARTYTNILDYGQAGDDIEAGLGLPI